MQGNLPIGHKSRLLTVEVAHSVISLNVIPVACALTVLADRSNPGIRITFSEILAVHTKNFAFETFLVLVMVTFRTSAYGTRV